MGQPAGRPPVVLTIAGSDPSAGAGIQADLKTCAALGAYAATVVTAVTAQNTLGVQAVHPLPPAIVREQLTSVTSDLRIDAVKVGMLGSGAVVDVVRPVLESLAAQGIPIVVDPVLRSTSGAGLLDDAGLDALRGMLGVVDLVTPNLAEAAVLSGHAPARDEAATVEQANLIRQSYGVDAVLLTGGHRADAPVDVLVDSHGSYRFPGRWVPTGNTHGTGCSLSAALAALGPRGDGWATAVRDGKDWLTRALERADDLSIGAGAGPVHHFHEWW